MELHGGVTEFSPIPFGVILFLDVTGQAERSTTLRWLRGPLISGAPRGDSSCNPFLAWLSCLDFAWRISPEYGKGSRHGFVLYYEWTNSWLQWKPLRSGVKAVGQRVNMERRHTKDTLVSGRDITVPAGVSGTPETGPYTWGTASSSQWSPLWGCMLSRGLPEVGVGLGQGGWGSCIWVSEAVGSPGC